MARAFVVMTGIDPTSVFSNQSPPVRDRPPSHGSARSEPKRRRRRTTKTIAATVLRQVRRNWGKAVLWACGLWAKAKRACGWA